MERTELINEENKIKLYLEACLKKKVDIVKISNFRNMDRKEIQKVR